MDIRAQTESKLVLPLHFLSMVGPQVICQLALVKAISFIHPADSHADLSQKGPHRHTQKSCLPATWAYFSPIKLTNNLDHCMSTPCLPGTHVHLSET